ncbi:MAG: ABC transporter ATP-binding protein [Planctomycetota bacterium]|jgi:phospholipid/cholesterol/gamma-HCH transport system ATP-binding protein
MESNTPPPEPESTSLICRLANVCKSFGRNEVLKRITLGFPEGATTVVLGPSGCGKSVMLKHLVALMRPDRGSVWFDGQQIDRLSESRLVPIRRQFGFLFQQGALFDSMTVADNVAFPLLEHTHLDRGQRRERVVDVLRRVGLEEAIEKMPADLSGGQRKRVALARAIVLRPRIILYDEPTTGLDPIRADVINELILKMQHQLKVTSIVVTHDLTSAFKVADRMVMLYDGHVVLEGDPQAVRDSSNPVVQRFLRGEATADELGAIESEGPVTEAAADDSAGR